MEAVNLKRLDAEASELKQKAEDEKLAIQNLKLVLIKRKWRAEKCRRLSEEQKMKWISGKLKRLRLAHCDDLSGEGLIKAIKQFPELEELHIISFFISSETIEMIGRSCPLLRSFAFNGQACYDIPDDVDAKAIAKSMPELRHLELLENGLTNEGLEAILDSCRHLESLDLRRCCHVNLRGDIARRCKTELKCLRYPHKSGSVMISMMRMIPMRMMTLNWSSFLASPTDPLTQIPWITRTI